MQAIGTKIGLLIFAQCPSYLLLLGRDAQAAEASPAAPQSTFSPSRGSPEPPDSA